MLTLVTKIKKYRQKFNYFMKLWPFLGTMKRVKIFCIRMHTRNLVDSGIFLYFAMLVVECRVRESFLQVCNFHSFAMLMSNQFLSSHVLSWSLCIYYSFFNYIHFTYFLPTFLHCYLQIKCYQTHWWIWTQV